jgi:hypothetical protein
MPSTRHTEFTPFVLDLLDFMEEKPREAIADEAPRAAAVSEAVGACRCCPIDCARTRSSRPSLSWCSATISTVPTQRSGGPGSRAWTDRPSRSKPRL